MIFSSYRFRVPLSLAAVVAVTAAVLSLAVAYQAFVNVDIEQQRTAQRLAHAMEPVLARAIKHDDVWLAFSLLRGPERSAEAPQTGGSPVLLLLDSDSRIFAANRPRRYPVGRDIAEVDADLARVGAQPESPGAASIGPGIGPGATALQFPVRSEDGVVGRLLIRPAEDAFWQRFREILLGGAWATALTLALFVPIGWLWGRRMVAPLTTLTDCMARVGRDDIVRLECPVLGNGRDEISQLGQQFQRLLDDLKGKREIEAQLVTQDRLAAIGRVAAAVAHEINNPLGGLMAAIDTYRHTPADRKNPDRTLDLIERGLDQIHEIVSALLVESRLENRALTRRDFDDVETLVLADASAGHKTIRWACELDEDLPLPATPVRQVLMNLALNAMQSTPGEGAVEIRIRRDARQLHIAVLNEGRVIEAGQLPRLFEPFYTARKGGSGLGLWVTYQTVSQLGGEISVESRDGHTAFEVTLPLSLESEEDGA
jgi:signal transduction histidine kinase